MRTPDKGGESRHSASGGRDGVLKSRIRADSTCKQELQRDPGWPALRARGTVGNLPAEQAGSTRSSDEGGGMHGGLGINLPSKR